MRLSAFLLVALLLNIQTYGQAQPNKWRGFTKPQYYPFNICSPATNIAKANCPNHIITKDIDGDGDLDIILDAKLHQNQSSQGPKIKKASVFINKGKGVFDKEIIFEKPDQYAFISDVADIDKDGHPEMVVHNFWKNGFWLYKGKAPAAGASFAFETPRFFATGSHGGDTFLVDYDKDGHLDIVSVSSGSVEPLVLHLFKGKGNGTFENKKKIQSGNGNISSHYQVLMRDLNQDGLPDFLVTDNNTQVSFVQTSAGVFEARWCRSPFKMPYPVLFQANPADSLRLYTADSGKLQILAASQPGKFVRLVQQKRFSIPLKKTSEKFQIADINHDGIADVLGVIVNTKAHEHDALFYALRNKEGKFYQPQYLPLSGKIDFKKFGYTVADINADGWVDVLAIVRGIDEVAVFLNKSNKGQSAKVLQTMPLDKIATKTKVLRKSNRKNTYKYYQKQLLFDISNRPGTYNRSLFLYDQKMIPKRFFIDGEIHNLEIALHKKLNQQIVATGATHLKIYLSNVPDSVLNNQHRNWSKTVQTMRLVYNQDPAKSLNTNFLPYQKHPNALIDFKFDKTFMFDPAKGKNLLMAIEYVQTKPTANSTRFQAFHNKGELKNAYHFYVRGAVGDTSNQLTETSGLRPMFTFNNNFDLRLTKLKTDIGQDPDADYNNIDLTLQNIRIRKADFALHPLRIHLKSVNSQAINIQPIEIKRGTLGFFRDTTISFFVPAIKNGGLYSIKAHIESIDNFLANDTIVSQVAVNKVNLPYSLDLKQVHIPKANKFGWRTQGTTKSSLRQQRRYGIFSVIFPLKSNDRKAYLKSPVFKVNQASDNVCFKTFATQINMGAYRALDNDDLLLLKVSLDGGKTYQTIAAYNHQNIKGATPVVRKVSLSKYVGKSISVAFYGVGGVSNGKYELHISNVKIGK